MSAIFTSLGDLPWTVVLHPTQMSPYISSAGAKGRKKIKNQRYSVLQWRTPLHILEGHRGFKSKKEMSLGCYSTF